MEHFPSREEIAGIARSMREFMERQDRLSLKPRPQHLTPGMKQSLRRFLTTPENFPDGGFPPKNSSKF